MSTEQATENLKSGPILSSLHSHKLYQNLLVEFRKDLPELVESIGEALNKEDFKSAQELSHQLKGTAATYGYPTLAQLAGSIEENLEQNNYAQAFPYFSQVGPLIERICMAP